MWRLRTACGCNRKPIRENAAGSGVGNGVEKQAFDFFGRGLHDVRTLDACENGEAKVVERFMGGDERPAVGIENDGVSAVVER